MKLTTLAMGILYVCLAFYTTSATAQIKVINGKVTDAKDGSGLSNVSILGTGGGSKSGSQTNADGTFKITVPTSVTKLIFTLIGYEKKEIILEGQTTINISLASTSEQINEVIVIGYGTSRKRDLTGSIASIQAKDFNKGVVTNPDQLLEGKVAGLQVINSSGQPGAATIVKIRGNNSIRSGNTPLYVIDGVPLDGRSPRPGLNNNSGVGTTPDVNPLLFINPSEIASIDVLKDASSSAIYGSRGANGVILVTTKKGQAGIAKIDVGASYGISGVMRKVKVLDAAGYRAALKSYNAPISDSGVSIDPFMSIINNNAPTQNYNIAFSGGNENGKYRASLLASDQQGIIRKSGLTKYVANFNGQYKFLDKRFSLDFNITAANVNEKIAPVSQDAGSQGNIISLGLIWNPTLVLQRSNGLYNQSNQSGQVNPLALSEAYNDIANVTTLLGNFSAGYKILPNLEYKLLYGVNYGTGLRKTELQGWISGTGGNADGAGQANISNTQLLSQTITHTLNYTAKLTQGLTLNALGGFEYWKTSWQGNQQYVYGFDLNLKQLSVNHDYHYYDNMSDGNQGNLRALSFKDPTVELQSYFARAVLNYLDRYLLTATFRADGSSKFGSNNRYAYFPSVAAAWNITSESFMKENKFFNSLKLRAGYGQTGNQEFNPVDAALSVGYYGAYNSFGAQHFANPDLKWETVQSVDIGIDFSVLHNRVYGFIDYFNKKTVNPILDFVIAQPTAGSGTVYKNMDGIQAQKAWVTNKGFEVSLGAMIIEKPNLTWSVSVNTTFVKNLFVSPDLEAVPYVKNTGALHGQGSSGAYSEVIANNKPIDVFYLPKFNGFDQNGIGKYGSVPEFSGDPNPSLFLGFSTELNYKKWAFVINTHGSFGNKIFNNTAMSVLNISNIIGGRSMASNIVGNGENTANAITPSTRFLENGNYMKLGNASISYRVGNIGKSIKGLNVFITGSNLFVITNYTGFDPEVNVNKALNGVPSLGVDYIGFPSARSFTAGVNFSL